VFSPGVSGKAVARAHFRYAIERNFDVEKPGSLSFWTRFVPGGRPPEGEHVGASWFMTDYKGTGYLGVERKSNPVGFLLWFHYFPDMPNYGSERPWPFQDGQWHFVVVAWSGLNWQVIVDGKEAQRQTLRRRIARKELPERFMVGASLDWMDEFTIYRHILSAEEMRLLLKEGAQTPPGD
jgi:hypothetical protein